jgi:hypothetical protein
VNRYAPAVHRVRSLAIATAALATLLTAGSADAERPVISAGREGEIAALLAPHRLGDDLAAGWTLHSVNVEVATIHVWISGPGQRFAHVTLDHPDHAPPNSRRLGGFALTRVDEPPGAEPAVAALVAALAHHDTDAFWAIKPAYAEEAPGVRPVPGAWPWRDDAVVLLTFFLLLGLLVHVLRTPTPGPDDAAPPTRVPAWVPATLLAIFTLGVVLRLVLPREVGLEAWPYTRFFAPAKMLAESPLLAALIDPPYWSSTLITATVLVLSCFASLTIFVHARYLLASHRAALIAAALIVVLPMHLRFSHSDVAFIGSMTISSLAFGMIHAATRERRWPLAAACLIFAVLPIALTYELRPDNMVYFPLLLATAFVDQGVWVDKPSPSRGRIALVALVVCAVTFGLGIPNLLATHDEQLRGGLSLDTLRAALEVAFSFTHNCLLNPEFTPPGLALLAMFGGYDLIKRGRRRLAAFLGGWLLMFLITHAYVVPNEPYMQARYHLHLVIPFVLLAACGIEGLIQRVQGRPRGRWILAALGAYLLASPFIHLSFIRNLEFNDPREWLWVHAQREAIPQGCTILEYTGRNMGSRFARVGASTDHGARFSRWTIVEIPAAPAGAPALPDAVRTLLAHPPECLYWYEGLPCWGSKPEGHEQDDGRSAPACRAVAETVELDEVARTEFASRGYDENLAKGITPGQPLVLRLSRVRAR